MRGDPYQARFMLEQQIWFLWSGDRFGDIVFRI